MTLIPLADLLSCLFCDEVMRLLIMIPTIPRMPVTAKMIIDFRNSPSDTDEPTAVDVIIDGIRAIVAVIRKRSGGILVNGTK